MTGYTPSSHIIDFLQAADKAGALNALTAKTADVITVANDIARYALTTAQPGQLVKVESTGMTYIAFPIDSSVRFGALNPSGNSVITIPCYSFDELATVILSPGEIVCTTDTRKLYIGSSAGNVELNSSSLPYSSLSDWYVPYEHMMIVTDAVTSPYSITLRSSTGYVAVRWWDGTVTVGGTGVAGSDITLTKTFTSTNNSVGGAAAPRRIYAWSVDSTATTANQSGVLTKVNAGYLSYADISKCKYLAAFNDDSGSTYSSIDLSKNQYLTSLRVSSLSEIENLDTSASHLVSAFDIINSKIKSLSIANNVSIVNVNSLTLLYSCKTFDISGCTSLRRLYLDGLDESGNVASGVSNLIGNAQTFTTAYAPALYISYSISESQSAMTIDALYKFISNLRYFSPGKRLSIYINDELDPQLISSRTVSPYFTDGLIYSAQQLKDLVVSKNIIVNVQSPTGGTSLFY